LNVAAHQYNLYFHPAAALLVILAEYGSSYQYPETDDDVSIIHAYASPVEFVCQVISHCANTIPELFVVVPISKIVLLVFGLVRTNCVHAHASLHHQPVE
jgi:hypothetical protein